MSVDSAHIYMHAQIHTLHLRLYAVYDTHIG